jgi:hypothetical protein
MEKSNIEIKPVSEISEEIKLVSEISEEIKPVSEISEEIKPVSEINEELQIINSNIDEIIESTKSQNELIKKLSSKLNELKYNSNIGKIIFNIFKDIINETFIKEDINSLLIILIENDAYKTMLINLLLNKNEKKIESNLIEKIESNLILEEQEKFYNTIFESIFEMKDKNNKSRYDNICDEYSRCSKIDKNKIWKSLFLDLSEYEEIKIGDTIFSYIVCIEKMWLFNKHLYEKCASYNNEIILHCCLKKESDNKYILNLKIKF